MEVPPIRDLGDVEALICLVGVDFDPDRRASEYTGPGVGPRFTSEQAARLDRAVEAAHCLCEQAGLDLGDLARRVVDELRHGPWPNLEDLVVLVVGGPLDGLRCLGPFPDSDSVDTEHRELRPHDWWLGTLDQLDLPAGPRLLQRLEVAMALLKDAAEVAAGDDRPGPGGELTEILWRLRALQLELDCPGCGELAHPTQ
jgi:hypothetical protein